MKTLERRNEDLQDRILKLEDEARQRENQQAKQIQDIKNAYEQQNSKLFEFVDFVKRYFPYVEKLMPTIKFLRDTLKFGDAVIRKLCTFKDVSIKGKLYSTMFNQSFSADGAVCSLKEDKERLKSMAFRITLGSDAKKMSLWKHWDYLQAEDKIEG